MNGVSQLAQHAQILCTCYFRLTGRELTPPCDVPDNLVERLENAPFALLSHGTQADPIFNYGNRIALELFEMDWKEFTSLPSRLSAEPINQVERARLLNVVSQQGFVDNYSGIRISKSGRRFMILNATVWNLYDFQEKYYGQAALIRNWQHIPA